MIIAIILGAITVVGITKTVRAVSADSFGPVPTRTYPNMFSIR
ncbi:MAG: hypothetical protein JWQ91_1987 [Aeromicrobium sp.]|jgi:hypothetical protein|nr:hypothetical protein [Aeromicrobium sp.]MCW2788003.1 hypothetical protein [Aeromicrobium sp.]MCW2825070.1 hypothetical protein [Aeromicrobium sp.]